MSTQKKLDSEGHRQQRHADVEPVLHLAEIGRPTNFYSRPGD